MIMVVMREMLLIFLGSTLGGAPTSVITIYKGILGCDVVDSLFPFHRITQPNIFGI